MKIDLEIGDKVKHSKIKGIHCGSDPRRIVIVINSTIETDLVVEWDMNHNTETNSYDVGKLYDIFFDSCGTIITTTKDHFLLNGTILKAFNSFENSFGSQSHSLGLYHGHRFDHNNHNWIINRQYMMMAFNYMNFVIKDKLEKNDPLCKRNMFDTTPYNYIFNRSTSFLDSLFVSDNHLILEEVLKNCMKYDPEIIELLAYVQPYNNKADQSDDQN